jgi:16S rRNA (uracil1498-N3)-methyltransferase
MNFFYSEDINEKNNEIFLKDQEHIHLVKSLRFDINEMVFITDGKGNKYETKLVEKERNTSKLEIINKFTVSKKKSKLNIAISPTKSSNRFEWFLEKVTEIGISSIYPLICNHSEKNSLNINRAKKILISSMKQSLQTYLPEIHDPTDFNTFVSSPFLNSSNLIATNKTNFNPKPFSEFAGMGNTLIMIGPEGGFSNDELLIAKNAKFTAVSLGNNRLRTETAGVACAMLHNLIKK